MGGLSQLTISYERNSMRSWAGCRDWLSYFSLDTVIIMLGTEMNYTPVLCSYHPIPRAESKMCSHTHWKAWVRKSSPWRVVSCFVFYSDYLWGPLLIRVSIYSLPPIFLLVAKMTGSQGYVYKPSLGYLAHTDDSICQDDSVPNMFKRSALIIQRDI